MSKKKYNKHELDTIEDILSEGVTTPREIAKKLKTTTRAYNRKIKNTESKIIENVLRRGYDRQAQSLVRCAEHGLKMLCTGFTVATKTNEQISMPKGHQNELKIVQVKEIIKTTEYPPNASAINFVLINQSDRWESINNFNVTSDSYDGDRFNIIVNSKKTSDKLNKITQQLNKK